MPVLGQRVDLSGRVAVDRGGHRMQEEVRGGFRSGTGHLARDGGGHRLAGQRECHVPDGCDATREGGQRPGPEVVYPDRFLCAKYLGDRGAHQVNVRVHSARENQQATRVEFLLAGHRAADLGYPAIPDPDIGDLPMPGDDDGPATDDKIYQRSSHSRILAQLSAPSSPCGATFSPAYSRRKWPRSAAGLRLIAACQ